MIKKIRFEIDFDSEEEAKIALEGASAVVSMTIKNTPQLKAMASKVIPIENGYRVIAEGSLKDNIRVKGMLEEDKK